MHDILYQKKTKYSSYNLVAFDTFDFVYLSLKKLHLHYLNNYHHVEFSKVVELMIKVVKLHTALCLFELQIIKLCVTFL
jgi:hypothetical protein